jgi:hypothetical protein
MRHPDRILPEEAPASAKSPATEPFAQRGFSFKIKACEKFYHRHIVDIPRIKFLA